MIGNLEELYKFNYKGSVLDISALLVYIRNENEEDGIKYLTGKGIDSTYAKKLVDKVKVLLSYDSSFATPDARRENIYKEMFGEPVFDIDGKRGRHLSVYKDFIVIDVSASVGSLLTGNLFDGEKIIFYADCIGIQYKKPGATIGFLQLETASPSMNNTGSNFFNENTFTFGEEDRRETEKAYRYIFERIKAIKTGALSE